MVRISESEVRAAVSAIIEREQREGVVSPIFLINESNRFWIRRNLRKHLVPVFSKGPLEEEKISGIIRLHQDEVRQYLEKQEPERAKRLSALTESYEKAWANRQAAIKHLAETAFISAPLILDKPNSIFVFPSGMFVEDHIESGNSWAKIIWNDDDDGDKETSVRFFFAWMNPSDSLVVINVSADLVVRGQCTVSAFPGLLFGGESDLFLTTKLKAYLSGVVIGGGHDQEQSIGGAMADTWGSLFGGDKVSRAEDVFSTANLSLKQVLVDVHQLVIIEVSFIAWYRIDNGSISLIFARDHPFLACPAVTIETLAPPT